jgi:hypothetical protein
MAVLIGIISISLVSADTSATIDFETPAEGDFVSTTRCGSGITCPSGSVGGSVSVFGSNPDFPGINTATVFDSECLGGFSGEDPDLFFPGHGNALINSEDLDQSDPDDQE